MSKQYDTSQYVQRPSEKQDRIHISKAMTNLTASTDIYDITDGKILYLTDLMLSATNGSTTNGGRLEIRDGGDAGELKTSLLLPMGILGALNPHESVSYIFPEPMQFYNLVRATEAAGTLTYAISFNGYEE